MASYKILPLRNEGIDLEKIKNRVENMSALESSADLRSGTLPRSFRAFQGEMCYVEYAQEEETEVTTLDADDDDTIKVADMYPIIFLGNGYVAYDANLPNQDVETEVVDMVSNLLDTDISYEAVEFDKDDLEGVVDQANKVREANFKPSNQKPNSVSARYLPGLQETEIWHQYENDPMEKVRVDLPDHTTYNVSFYEKGKVTVHGRKIPEDIQVEVLRYITDEVVSNLDIDSFQKKLGGEF
ncbi:hypothetical protein [Haloarcula argentinensis]|uniref:Uncharacterized protein n=1 Tax=Haloarcula argentinensis TaxID=43776 RepID=A0A847UL33_HALAR|nr:hypothetical protein [Haloarcula argentinensis]NLV13216.1 hypothetical protein [Haloarcula argentinensis]